MKIHSSSCEIEDFVETHLCKLCDTPIARITSCVPSLRIQVGDSPYNYSVAIRVKRVILVSLCAKTIYIDPKNDDLTVSTIDSPPPAKTSDFLLRTFHHRSWLLDARKDDVVYMGNIIFIYFLVCKGLSNDDVEVARGTALQEVRPGAGFQNRRFR